MATGRKSAAKRQQVALCLAAGKTAKRAAADCGVGERTVGYWNRDPAFRALVEDTRAELFARAVATLAGRAAAAAGELGRLLNDQDPRVRLRAAVAILTVGNQLRQDGSLEQRVRDLEDRIDPPEGQPR
jgi:hypothetical protein